MSKMIPRQFSPEVKSNAERKIFDLFQNSPGTENWVVFHSLGISNHNRVIYGEIDFVVLAPKLGLFALEVKGGRVRREMGKWYFTNRYGQSNSKLRGPFEQAKDGVFSLIKEIQKIDDVSYEAKNILFGYGVMFPDIEYIIEDLDSEQWQVYDENNNGDIVSFIKHLSSNSIHKWEEKYGKIPSNKIPTKKEVKELTRIIRPDFDFPVTLDTKIRIAESKIDHFTSEQLRCLDQLEDNARILIQGRAGTGKTLIALEEAKRKVVDGKRIAFFCFNKLLAKWIIEYFKDLPDEMQPVYVGTFHSYMLDRARESCQEEFDFDDPEFYKYELPIYAIQSLEDNDVSFDQIIVDEAQDLLIPEYLAVMDSMLTNGIDRGRWSFYGDFELQKLYCKSDEIENGLQELDQKTSFIRFKLTMNCRNTRQIGQEVNFLTESKNQLRFLNDIDGPPVDYLIYKSSDEHLEKLQLLLENLIKVKKIEKSKITILSPRKYEKSIVSCIDNKKCKIRQYSIGDHKEISFSTVHSFKGLENSVIIICDLETINNKELLYTGLSRAKTKLYIFESKTADKERKSVIRRSFQ